MQGALLDAELVLLSQEFVWPTFATPDLICPKSNVLTWGMCGPGRCPVAARRSNRQGYREC